MGCGGGASDAPELVEVEGKVTHDDTPVTNGEIIFRATDGSRADAGRIVDGSYQATVTPGKKRIEITAMKTSETGQTLESGEQVIDSEQYIPAAYNSESTLEWDVPADGGTKDFALENK